MPARPTRSERQAAENEAFFRDVNEHAERRREAYPGIDSSPGRLRFVCECGNDACTDAIFLYEDEYRAVRSNPRAFVLVPGHEVGEFETVIQSHGDHVVVEKRTGD